MRRPPSQKHATLKEIHPLSKWCFCLKCRYEFSREIGWEIKTVENDHTIYLCKQCAPTEEVALAFAKSFRLSTVRE